MASDSFQAQLAFLTDLYSNTRLRRDFVASIVDKLQMWTSCQCVGIRIINPDDYIPYEAYVGFLQEFWECENWLSLQKHQCVCIRVVKNETLPTDQPILTENGSILSNDLQVFGESLSVAESCLYRGKCIDSGFRSLALVPIRKQGAIIGLIHLADKRPHMLPSAMIQDIEALTVSIAEMIERFSTEDCLTCQKAKMEQLLCGVSHDLKSPLITVSTFLSMLRQDLQNADQQRINEDLNYIDKATGRMHQMIEALQHYSRIDRKDSPPQNLAVRQQVEDCLNTLADTLRQKKVQVTIGEMPYQLHGDLLHFRRIWQTLIANAVKHMGDQPQPHIEIGATQQAPNVVFYVRDNGVGIAPEHHRRIFNIFSQLNPESDGSNLELVLVKKIVSIYHGRIWVESAGKGKGSCFYFTLPEALVNREMTI